MKSETEIPYEMTRPGKCDQCKMRGLVINMPIPADNSSFAISKFEVGEVYKSQKLCLTCCSGDMSNVMHRAVDKP